MSASEEFQTIARALWVRFSELRRRLPLSIQVAVGLFAFFLVSIAIYTTLTARDSILHLRVQHSFRTAQIDVWVDDDSVYSGKLTGTIRKKYGFFGETLQGSMSREIPISSGSHRVRVQIISSGGSLEQDSLVGDFPKNGDRTLLVNAHSGDVALSWQDSGISGTETEGTTSGNWLSRYATTLIMTIAGSIVSALTGFAIKEIPGYLKSRQTTQ